MTNRLPNTETSPKAPLDTTLIDLGVYDPSSSPRPRHPDDVFPHLVVTGTDQGRAVHTHYKWKTPSSLGDAHPEWLQDRILETHHQNYPAQDPKYTKVELLVPLICFSRSMEKVCVETSEGYRIVDLQPAGLNGSLKVFYRPPRQGNQFILETFDIDTFPFQRFPEDRIALITAIKRKANDIIGVDLDI